jgi:uncharacterized protein YjgD (DUF1641 family)
MAMNDPTDAVSDALGAAANAITDNMVERLATTLSNSMELADRLNDPDTREAVDALLQGLTRLHRTGDLAAAFELLHVLGAVRSAATDSMIERGAGLLEHLLSNLANEEVADLAHETQAAMRDARQEAAAAPAKGGLMATLGLLSKPETQEALRFLVSITNKMKARR